MVRKTNPRTTRHDRLDPPSSLKSILWFAGLDLAWGLNSLPIGIRLARRGLVSKPRRPPLISAAPRDLVNARRVVDALLADGYQTACREFNRHLLDTRVSFPLLRPSPPKHLARKEQQSAAMVRREGTRTFFPPALSTWLILIHPEAHPRLRRCRCCRMYFFARSRHKRTYCSVRCKSRQTVSDLRSRRRFRQP